MFCQLAYLNFPRKFCGAPKRTLSRLVEANGLAEGTFYVKSNNKLIAAVAASPRFGDVRVGFFRQRNSDKRVVRFAAVTFLLPDDSVYVAFRGTDTTVLGWKEDFYMSFLKVIPSHILAQNYLQTVGSTLSGRLYVGGHSKGGNLAEYSACMASPQIQQRIEMVFNHDGPGFVDSIYHTEQYLCIAERVNKTIPRDSMVGLLLNTRQDYQVVDSTSLLLLQHNPFTWKILQDGSFKRLNGLSYVSQVFDETLTEWIFGMDLPARRKLVGCIFAVLEGSGCQNVTDIGKKLVSSVRGMHTAYKSLDDDGKKLMTQGGKELLRLWLGTFFVRPRKPRNL